MMFLLPILMKILLWTGECNNRGLCSKESLRFERNNNLFNQKQPEKTGVHSLKLSYTLSRLERKDFNSTWMRHSFFLNDISTLKKYDWLRLSLFSRHRLHMTKYHSLQTSPVWRTVTKSHLYFSPTYTFCLDGLFTMEFNRMPSSLPLSVKHCKTSSTNMLCDTDLHWVPVCGGTNSFINANLYIKLKLWKCIFVLSEDMQNEIDQEELPLCNIYLQTHQKQLFNGCTNMHCSLRCFLIFNLYEIPRMCDKCIDKVHRIAVNYISYPKKLRYPFRYQLVVLRYPAITPDIGSKYCNLLYSGNYGFVFQNIVLEDLQIKPYTGYEFVSNNRSLNLKIDNFNFYPKIIYLHCLHKELFLYTCSQVHMSHISAIEGQQICYHSSMEKGLSMQWYEKNAGTSTYNNPSNIFVYACTHVYDQDTISYANPRSILWMEIRSKQLCIYTYSVSVKRGCDDVIYLHAETNILAYANTYFISEKKMFQEPFKRINPDHHVRTKYRKKTKIPKQKTSDHINEKTFNGNEELHLKRNMTSLWTDASILAGHAFEFLFVFTAGVVNVVFSFLCQNFLKHKLNSFDHQLPKRSSKNKEFHSSDTNFQSDNQFYTLQINLNLDTYSAVFVFEVMVVHVYLYGCFLKQIFLTVTFVFKFMPNSPKSLIYRFKIRNVRKTTHQMDPLGAKSVLKHTEDHTAEKEIQCGDKEIQYDDTVVFEIKNSDHLQFPASTGDIHKTIKVNTPTADMIWRDGLDHMNEKRNSNNSDVTIVKEVFDIDIPNAASDSEHRGNHQTFPKLLEDFTSDEQQIAAKLLDESDFNISPREIHNNVSKEELISFYCDRSKSKYESLSSLCIDGNEELILGVDTSYQEHCSLSYKIYSDTNYSSSYTDSQDFENSFSSKSNLSSLSAKCDKDTSKNLPSSTFQACCTSMSLNTKNKDSTYKYMFKPFNDKSKFENSAKKVISLSHNKDNVFTRKIPEHHNKQIERSVRKFFLSREQRRRKRNNRRLKRRMQQCVSMVNIFESCITICNPLHTTESSNTVVREESNQSEFLLEGNQNSVNINDEERNQTATNNHDTSIYDREQGNLSSIFNSFSIDSFLEEQRYHVEWMRLASFANFESASVHPIRLARNGWYSTGNRDQTVCFCCHRIHENWRRDDNPDDFHDTGCRVLLSTSNNISIPRVLSEEENESTPEKNQATAIATDLAASDISSLHTVRRTSERSGDLSAYRTSENLESTAASSTNNARHTQLEALKRDPMGINFDRPKYPSYAILSVRVSSFSDWPSDKTQTPRDLALAGFFYAGYGDYTRCFFCGGGLRNWEDGDDPWVEHARWFSQCAFVRQNKGQDFIDLVQQRAQELEREHRGEFQNDLSEHENSKDEKVMKSEAVLAIKGMGYTEDIIRAAIKTLKSRLSRGRHRVSTHDIIEVILELESKTKPQAKHQETTSAEQASGDRATSADGKDSDDSDDDTGTETRNDLTPEAMENMGTRDQVTCQICMEKKVSIAFLPCSHLVCCGDCAPAMRTCPFCRKFIKGTVKTFLV